MKTITAKLVVSNAVAARFNDLVGPTKKRATKKRRTSKKRRAQPKLIARTFGGAATRKKASRKKSGRGNPNWASQPRRADGRFKKRR